MFLLCAFVTIPQALAGTKALVDKSVFSANGKRATVPLPQAAIEALGARVVEDYETMAVVDLGPANARGLSEAVGLSVSPLPNHDKILLRDYTLDSSSGLPPGLTNPAFPGNASNLYLVVFRSIPKPEWLESLETSGARVVSYMPENAYLAYGSLNVLEAFRAKQGPVINVLPYVPAFRHLEGKNAFDPDGYGAVMVKVLDVPTNNATVAEIRGAALPGTLSSFELDGATCFLAELPSTMVEGLAYEPEVISIERAPHLQPSGERSALIVAGELDTVSQGGRDVFVPKCSRNYYDWLNENQLSNLSDITLGILDTGLDIGSTSDVHKDFLDTATPPSSRVVYQGNEGGSVNGPTDCVGHGTLVASVMAGSGGSTNATQFSESTSCGTGQFWMGTGIAPTANIASSKIYDDIQANWTAIPGRTGTALGVFAYRGIPIANLSSNDTSESGYSSFAQLLDTCVRDATAALPGGLQTHTPILITVSAGNDTFTPVGEPGPAKNVITVGASEGYNPNSYDSSRDQKICWDPDRADNAYDVASKSCVGTPDGRVKPDVVAPGTKIVGAATRDPNYALWSRTDHSHCWTHVDCLPNFIATDGTYGEVGAYGTSFAAPAAAGAAGLLYKWFKTRLYGQAPSPATTKAMLINSAVDIQGGRYDTLTVDHIPSNYQGWGKVDLRRSFPTGDTWFMVNQSVVFTASGGSPWVGQFQVPSGATPVRVTLVWTDAPGSPGSSHPLVNDLDLKVSLVDSNNQCWMAAGNTSISESSGLSVLVPCSSTLVLDTDNNVEQVIFSANAGTYFEVTVTPRSLNAKALPWGAGPVNQDFGLFVENGRVQ